MSYPYAGGSNKPATKIWFPMWGLWLVVSKVKCNNTSSSLLAGRQQTTKLYKNCLLSMRKTQKTYNFPAAANRLTFAVHNSITKHSQQYTVETMCMKALPIQHRGTLDVAMQIRTGSLRSQTSLTVKGWLYSCREVIPPTDRRWNWLCQERCDTVQWTICCARGTWHWQGAWSTELCASAISTELFKVPGALWLKCHEI